MVREHGRCAVFFGRMVPIVRKFVSVPAGVVKMPFLPFLVYTAGGSLIWNSVLIGLGVAAGDFSSPPLLPPSPPPPPSPSWRTT